MLKVQFYFDFRVRHKLREGWWEFTLWTGWLKAEGERMPLLALAFILNTYSLFTKYRYDFLLETLWGWKTVADAYHWRISFTTISWTESVHPLLVHPIYGLLITLNKKKNYSREICPSPTELKLKKAVLNGWYWHLKPIISCPVSFGFIVLQILSQITDLRYRPNFNHRNIFS